MVHSPLKSGTKRAKPPFSTLRRCFDSSDSSDLPRPMQFGAPSRTVPRVPRARMPVDFGLLEAPNVVTQWTIGIMNQKWYVYI